MTDKQKMADTNQGVSVKELKNILDSTKAPRQLVDPVTELPLWDKALMNKIKNAKSYDEVGLVIEQVRQSMVIEKLYCI